MSDLIITEEEWQPFDGENGHILSAKIKKRDGRMSRSVNVIIWTVLFKDHPNHGKFFIVEPQRTKSIAERYELAIYDSIDGAKEDAEKMFREYLDKIRSGKISWWTKKEMPDK